MVIFLFNKEAFNYLFINHISPLIISNPSQPTNYI